MVNLKKPLEGAPGLLLLAALVLFGATVGVSLALMFSWVEMKDSLANFLGGVVGAGLGAALAVLGAVYVQHKERRAQLTAPLNELREKVGFLRVHLMMLRDGLEFPWLSPEYDDWEFGLRASLRKAEDILKTVGDMYELPVEMRSELYWVRELVPSNLAQVRRALDDPATIPEDQRRKTAVANAEQSIQLADNLLAAVKKWLQ